MSNFRNTSRSHFSKFRIVVSLAAIVSVSISAFGCGGTEKGKNKDLDRPISTATK